MAPSFFRVWTQSNGNQSQVYKSEYRTGAWTNPTKGATDPISTPGSDAISAGAAMDDGGNALIVWKQFDGTSWRLYKREYR